VVSLAEPPVLSIVEAWQVVFLHQHQNTFASKHPG